MSGYSLNGSNVIPYTPGQSGVKIQYGTANSPPGPPYTNQGTVTFPVAFTSKPVVTTGMYQGSYSLSYTVAIYDVSSTSFKFKKWYNTGSGADGEEFYWIAIGN